MSEANFEIGGHMGKYEAQERYDKENTIRLDRKSVV